MAARLDPELAKDLDASGVEYLVFNHFSTGAADDLGRATEIVRSMVTRYGMVEEVGHVNYEDEPGPFLGAAMPGLRSRSYKEDTAREIDNAARRLVQQALNQAREILEDTDRAIKEGAIELLDRETTEESELSRIFADFEGEES